jgi:UrcA family protein
MSHQAGTVLGSVAAIVLSIASSALYADSAPGEIRHSTAVHYADLNLNQPAGVAALYRRITLAANRVCGQRTLTGSNYPLPGYTSCYNKAIASAVARVDHPQLSAYYRAQVARSGSSEIASLPSR